MCGGGQEHVRGGGCAVLYRLPATGPLGYVWSMSNHDSSIEPIARGLYPEIREKMLSKAMLPNSLGELEAVAARVAMIQRTLSPSLNMPHLLLAAGDHGVVVEGVTTSPKEITWQQCCNFARGGGACGLLAKLYGVKLVVCDVGVDHDFDPQDGVVDCKVAYGTKDLLLGPAMTMEQCRLAMAAGRKMVRDVAEKGCDVIAFGEMGIGNTTSASALTAALTGWPAEMLTSRGAAQNDAGFSRKLAVVKQAVSLHGRPEDPVETMVLYGGFELAFIMGGMLEAAVRKMVILLDGFIATASALAAVQLEPAVVDYMIPCHCSVVAGHRQLLEHLGLVHPLLDLGMWLGEGTGTLMAWPIVRASVALLTDMTSFSECGVTDSTILAESLYGSEVFR